MKYNTNAKQYFGFICKNFLHFFTQLIRSLLGSRSAPNFVLTTPVWYLRLSVVPNPHNAGLLTLAQTFAVLPLPRGWKIKFGPC